MSRNLSLYLDDILTSIGKLELAHNLQVIGEAVKTIPTERRDRLAIALK